MSCVKLIACIAALLSVAADAPPALVKHEQLLYPVVRIRAEQAGGSGTIVYCGPDKSGAHQTYVLTNHHVVEMAIKVDSEAWDPLLGRKRAKESRIPVRVELFQYDDRDEPAGDVGFDADIVAYARQDDIALLKLRTAIRPAAARVARLATKEEADKVRLFHEVCLVGAALGHAPIPTFGMLVSKADLIDGLPYWMTNANFIFGNSGGAVFYRQSENSWVFLGIPSRMSITGFGGTPVTHMIYFVPPSRIVRFLDDSCYQFIYDAKKTIEECDRAREARRRDGNGPEK